MTLELDPEERVALALLVGAVTSHVLIASGDTDPAMRRSMKLYLAEVVARWDAARVVADKVLQYARTVQSESVAIGRTPGLIGRNVLTGDPVPVDLGPGNSPPAPGVN